MPDPRPFPLGVVLSITTGRLLAAFPDVQEALEYLVGEPVWTHQMPRVTEEVAPLIVEQHPKLRQVIVPPDLIPEGAEDPWAYVERFLQVVQRGVDLPPTLRLEPVPAAHVHLNPVAELQAMLGPDKPVVAVVVPDDEPPRECPECDGTGSLVASPDRLSRVYSECPACGGSGVVS